MFETSIRSDDPYVGITHSLLQDILSDFHPRDIAFKFWDGSVWQQEAGQPRRCTIVLKHPGSLRKMFFPATQKRLGEAYVYEDFDVEGDLLAAMDFAYHLWGNWSLSKTLQYAWRLLRLPSGSEWQTKHQATLSGGAHSVSRDTEAVQFHYDLSNDFYRLWLDERMVYSCAYFASPDESIDIAQERKLDFLCRKLRLKAGERLLDIGCGWGSLLIHAAKHYGVKATGITLSENQAQYARERIKEANLEAQCTVELLDYREVVEAYPYDKIVSVGMVEHVGEKNYPTYFSKAYRLLRPGGVFLVHGITAERMGMEQAQSKRKSFFQNYIFPDGDVLPLAVYLEVANNVGFEIRDVESLREHYALTLKQWYQRFEANRTTVMEHIDRTKYRIWKVYLNGARWIFEKAHHNVHQALLYKASDHANPLPLTRMDWYQDSD